MPSRAVIEKNLQAILAERGWLENLGGILNGKKVEATTPAEIPAAPTRPRYLLIIKLINNNNK